MHCADNASHVTTTSESETSDPEIVFRNSSKCRNKFVKSSGHRVDFSDNNGDYGRSNPKHRVTEHHVGVDSECCHNRRTDGVKADERIGRLVSDRRGLAPAKPPGPARAHVASGPRRAESDRAISWSSQHEPVLAGETGQQRKSAAYKQFSRSTDRSDRSDPVLANRSHLAGQSENSDIDCAISERKTTVGEQVTRRRFKTIIKLGNYDGTTSLETFLAKFENCATYCEWDDRDRVFHLRACLEGAAGQILWDAGEHVSLDKVIRLLR
jgi:hypothetical protein